MTEEVVTVEAGSSLRRAAAEMVENDIGSVVVTEKGTPEGIVTERDALDAGGRSDLPFSEIPVRKIMSYPLKTVEPGASLQTVVKEMNLYGVKKLLVMDGLELVGIVTTTDVLSHVNDIRREAQDLVKGGEEW